MVQDLERKSYSLGLLGVGTDREQIGLVSRISSGFTLTDIVF